MRSRNKVMAPKIVRGVPVDGLLPEDRVALQALVDAAYRKMPELRNLNAMRVGKLAEDVERYSALNARLFAEKTAAQIELEGLREALFRLWPAVEKAMAGLVFTADRAGEVQADMNTLRASLKTPNAKLTGAQRPAPTATDAPDAPGR